MKKQLLFVTTPQDGLEEGFPYAMDLAGAMKEDIAVLVCQSKGLMEKFQDAMSAVTFAEVGEAETARSLVMGPPREDEGIPGIEKLRARCVEAGIGLRSYSVGLSPVDAVREFLRLKKGIDMVLLSPGITSRGKVRARDLTRLMRTASRPVVTMTRQPIPQAV
ncbi:MAG: hypothetical protein ACWGN7_02580 [Thermodesulfovibrionales bacterium]